MILDASVIVAILEGEPDYYALVTRLSHSTTNRISAASFLETSIVIDGRRNPVLSGRLDELLDIHKVIIEPVTGNQARIARQAYRDYGRGSGHPAGLNFGDCFAYALAKDLAETLLFKGDDFSHTDVRSAMA